MESVSTKIDSNKMLNEEEIDDEYFPDEQISMQLNNYNTTTLITQWNITLADILLTAFNSSELEPLERSIKPINNY